MRIVLPARGGLTISPRWPKPMGTIISTTRMLISSGVDFHADPLVGMQRRQLVEGDLVDQQVRVLVVDRLDAQQGEVTLVLLGRADLARDGRPGLQAEAADLAGRDVDVVRAGKIVVVGAAEEAEAVGQDLQRPLAVHQAVELDPLLEDFEDQVLLLDAGVVGDVLLAGLLDQLGHRHLLQLGDVRVGRLLDLLVALADVVRASGPRRRRSLRRWRAALRRRCRRNRDIRRSLELWIDCRDRTSRRPRRSCGFRIVRFKPVQRIGRFGRCSRSSRGEPKGRLVGIDRTPEEQGLPTHGRRRRRVVGKVRQPFQADAYMVSGWKAGRTSAQGTKVWI